MTQFLYNLEFRLQTSGDCSTFTILGPEGSRELLGEIIDKLKQWKFTIDDTARGDFIHFRATPLGSEVEGLLIREEVLAGIAVQLKAELDLALEEIERLRKQIKVEAEPRSLEALLSELHEAMELKERVPTLGIEVIADFLYNLSREEAKALEEHDARLTTLMNEKLGPIIEEFKQVKIERTPEEIQERVDDNFFDEEYN